MELLGMVKKVTKKCVRGVKKCVEVAGGCAGWVGAVFIGHEMGNAVNHSLHHSITGAQGPVLADGEVKTDRRGDRHRGVHSHGIRGAGRSKTGADRTSINPANPGDQPDWTKTNGGLADEYSNRTRSPNNALFGVGNASKEESTYIDLQSVHRSSVPTSKPTRRVTSQSLVSEPAQPVVLSYKESTKSGSELIQRIRAENYIKTASNLGSKMKPEEVTVQGKKEVDLRFEMEGALRRRKTVA
ncbi:hypothetical protein FGG08_004363 [Glutinoglossum americanum]|uniref:Uncharacterized protein n=1 Tax=Glutinoglossum americanum TaxID=1670608 RepID=A0A9P8IBJ0_9PEZI|nr:hypothetical protein FGG08_004363 [Glutinoglossum americanum]